MRQSDGFYPDWASAPGDTIRDLLYERNILVAEFAESVGCDTKNVLGLLQGRVPITVSMARRLSQVLGASVEFWMSRDFHFRQDAIRIHGGGREWLSELPLRDMTSFGWLSPAPHPTEELSACLSYFGVTDIPEWHSIYRTIHDMAVFRTSPSYDSRPASVAVWLRQGEVQAEAVQCTPWDPDRFHSSLSDLRSLTRQKDPVEFIPKLQDVCKRSGVAVVVVRAPNGCRASGATRFVSPDKAILQMSFRYLTDDHFWFTFFHEAGHLLLHEQRNLFSGLFSDDSGWIIEGLESSRSAKEDEADQFAARILVPKEFDRGIRSLRIETRSIIRFAARLGVSPGIVVGQLQHLGRIGFDQMNGLKRRFKWEGSTPIIRGRAQSS